MILMIRIKYYLRLTADSEFRKCAWFNKHIIIYIYRVLIVSPNLYQVASAYDTLTNLMNVKLKLEN